MSTHVIWYCVNNVFNDIKSFPCLEKGLGENRLSPPSTARENLGGFLARIIDGLRKRLRGWNLVAVIAIIVLVGYGGWVFFETSPAANVLCATCHSMVPFYEEFQDSPHKQFNCHVCHELSTEVILAALNPIQPTPEEIREGQLYIYKQCISCHNPKDLEGYPLHEIHLSISEIANTCTFCHSSHRLEPENSDCTRCHNLDRMLERHQGFHRYVFAVTILRNATLAQVPEDLRELILNITAGQLECYRCHGEYAVWNVPLGEECYQGFLEGKTCIDCHQELPEADIMDNKCIDCHRK